MNKNTIDDISAIINEKVNDIYDTAVTMANLKLLNGYESSPTAWSNYQRANTRKLKEEVSQLIKKEIKPLFNSIDKAFLLAVAVSSGTFRGMDDLEQKEVKVEMLESFKPKLDRIKIQVAKDLNKLPNEIFKMQHQNINEIYTNVKNNPRVKTLYDGITKQTNLGVKNAPKIAYRDGRQMQFTNYMDMNVRTTFQQVSGEMQEEAGRNAGVIFWICSSHGDCANDHADYQGKIYIDSGWETMVDEKDRARVYEYIAANGTLTKQDIESGPPYLTTRPNCRHYWMPLSIEEVLGSSTDKLLKEKNLYKGKADSSKYLNLQRQRYEERLVRHYKQRKEQTELMLKKMPKGEEKDKLERQLMRDNKLVDNHRQAIATLVKKHPYLDREFSREDPRIVRNDLGVRFNTNYKKKVK